MNPLPDPIKSLPRVASPAVWSWHYFRVRYLASLTSILVVVAVVSLWTVNLPEPTGAGVSGSVSRSAEGIANVKPQFLGPASINGIETNAVPSVGNPGPAETLVGGN